MHSQLCPFCSSLDFFFLIVIIFFSQRMMTIPWGLVQPGCEICFPEKSQQ